MSHAPTEALPSPTPAPIPDAAAKRDLYRTLLQQAQGILDGIEDKVTRLATAVAVVHHALPYASWTGVYRVVEDELLRVGPYQGPVACLEIDFGRGVCGTAASERRTQVVPDVHAFPGHIACDAAARSEIVVPLDDARGDLYGVLDVDSHLPDAFDEVDREGLEALAQILAG